MVRKFGMLAIVLAIAGSSFAAKIEGKDERDTKDSAVWLVNVNKAGTVFFPIINLGF